MPKTAAAILGFALVIGAIGFNTTRYPVVWKMVGPEAQASAASETAPSSTASQATAPACPPPVTPEQASGEPATDVTSHAESVAKSDRKSESDNSSSPPSGRSKASRPEPPDAVPDAVQTSAPETPPRERPQNPLVQVMPPSESTDAAGNSESAESVRRLPPVDHPGTGSDKSATAQSIASSNATYPTTSTP
jgi:hypothetical protein